MLAQSYRHAEYVVIDGESRDGSQELIRAYENEFNKRGIPYRWISERDAGIYNAMNKGNAMARAKHTLALATAEYGLEQPVVMTCFTFSVSQY